ncbi:MAG: circularly permuted type 2 ATP-grasp protein [Gammaproteobacteria bacterium]|nr:circularly permuted type 2 ATP-grasp protein [Gammaproteobacteria bacterium]
MSDLLLTDYTSSLDRFDELLSSDRKPRTHWRALCQEILNTDAGVLANRIDAAERQIRDSGVTYNVYADPEGLDRPWELDVVPMVIPASEWRTIEAGVAQRARLLDRILADLYGPQKLLREGLIPPALVLGHSGFVRNVVGAKPPGDIFLHLYAADLARSPDGQWWVLTDRTQAPSGAGYALENRLIVSQVFSDLFRSQKVRHLAQFFATLRDTLMHHAPKGDGPTTAVVWTPGPYNETYFEHALIARYLGFRLVEGSDLVVRDGKVWLKTVEGRRRIHAIVRRQDDDFCDPLELRADSALGVPGITDCVRRGSVLMANPLGTGVLESGALLGFLPRLCEELLDEQLMLPSIATWWCGEPAALADALGQFEHLVFKPADPIYRFEPVFGHDLTQRSFSRLRRQIASQPERFVAQELVRVSQGPVMHRYKSKKLAARGIGLRVFATTAAGGYAVMPGGLTRVAADADPRVVSMQRGGSSKDTWVLADGPVDTQFTLLRSTVTPADLVRNAGGLSSRVAENLFWFGRYAERSEDVARLLRVALNSVLQESEDGEARPVFELVESAGIELYGDDLSKTLSDAATLESVGSGLAANLSHLNRIAFQLRDRLSMDHWRTITHLIRDPVFNKPATLAQTLAMLDRTITHMTTTAGYTLDSMTRDTGYRFVSIGRRLERLSFMTLALSTAFENGADCGLTWLLELADSVITYRTRYMAQPEWLPVLDLVLRDESNPRSVMFQAKGMFDFLGKLEQTLGPCGREELGEAVDAIRGLDLARDFDPASGRLRLTVAALNSAAYGVSEFLTDRFFNQPRASKWHPRGA